MSDDYDLHRQRQLAQARDAFTAFVARLSPRQRLLARCIGPAEDDNEMANGRNKDAAELPVASYRVDMAAEVDTFADAIVETFALESHRARLLATWMENEIQRRAMTYRSSDINKISGVFIDAKNPKLFSAGLAFAADLASLNGLGTQAQFARRIGLSRAAMSKTTKFWQELLNLPPSSHMKSEAACVKYAEVARKDHWRNRKADGSEKSTKTLKRLGKRFAAKISHESNGTNGHCKSKS